MPDDAAKQFVLRVHDQLGLWATWEPTQYVTVGTIGTLIDGWHFHRLSGPVSDLEIEKSPPTRVPAMVCTSKSGFEMKSKLAGKTSELFEFLATAEAGISIDLRDGRSSLLIAQNCRIDQLKDEFAVLERVRLLLVAGRWPANLVLVTRRVYAKNLFVALSGDAGCHIEFKASADVPAGGLDLAKLAGKLRGGISRGVQIEFNLERATPLFDEPIRIRKDKRSALGFVVDSSGTEWVADTPIVSPYGATWDPNRSELSREEILAMDLEELFERVAPFDATEELGESGLEPSEIASKDVESQDALRRFDYRELISREREEAERELAGLVEV